MEQIIKGKRGEREKAMSPSILQCERKGKNPRFSPIRINVSEALDLLRRKLGGRRGGRKRSIASDVSAAVNKKGGGEKWIDFEGSTDR